MRVVFPTWRGPSRISALPRKNVCGSLAESVLEIIITKYSIILVIMFTKNILSLVNTFTKDIVYLVNRRIKGVKFDFFDEYSTFFKLWLNYNPERG